MATVTYPTGVIEVADRAYAFIQEGGMTNAGFIVGEEGVLVINALMTPTLAIRLLSAVRHVTRAPIRYLVITHFHGDHTGASQYYLPSPILCHVNCRQELQENWDAIIHRYLTTRPEQQWEFSLLRLTLPDVTFQDRMTVRLGDRVVEISHLGRAHTKGDALLYLPQEKLLYAGDIAFLRFLPAFPDGHITGWLKVMDEVERMDLGTVVPGHGPVGTRAEFLEAKEVMGLLRQEIRRYYDQGATEEQAVQGVNLGKFASFGGQERMAQIVKMAYLDFSGQLS